MESSIGRENKVFILDAKRAVFICLGLSSGGQSTIPRTFFDLAK